MNKSSRVQGAIDSLLGALRFKERKVGGLASGIELREKDLRAVSGGYRGVEARTFTSWPAPRSPDGSVRWA